MGGIKIAIKVVCLHENGYSKTILRTSQKVLPNFNTHYVKLRNSR